MTDWRTVPIFGEAVPQFPVVVRPSAYGLIPDEHGRLALVRTPSGIYLPGGGQLVAEIPATTVIREVREECGLIVRVGSWRQAAVEHVSSFVELTHFEKQSTFCDAAVVAAVVASVGDATDTDHTLIWMLPEEAMEALTPKSHSWAITEWLRYHTTNQ